MKILSRYVMLVLMELLKLERLNFVNFTSKGSGVQNLKYPDIKAEVVVSTNSASGCGTVVVTPVIRGEIIQVYTEDADSMV